MNEQRVSKDLFYRLEGYYLIPHELLHVLAYRLIGKQYSYKWGNHRIFSTASKTHRERLFILLFPGVVCWLFAFFFSILWLLSVFFIDIPPERYFIDGPTWHFAFPIIASLFVLYSGTAYRDIRRVLQILSGQDKSQENSPEPHQQAKEK
jgi:hypothetical protein